MARLSGVIGPVAAEYVEDAIEKAEKGRFSALVIELDTPGGLDDSMREIVKAILAAGVAVIVYVSPEGARAASAGVFIAMAAPVAAMAPGTNIGAAHPVRLGSPEPDKKMANDAGAYLQALAARRGRSVEWAARLVAQSSSIPVAVALRDHVVDLQADNIQSLLEQVDGRVLPDFKTPLRAKGATLIRFEMTRRQKLLAAVSNPNIAMTLMSLGVSGLLIELYSPGLILPGVVGALSLILAFYSFQSLSANAAGLLLMGLGALLYILELKIASFGLLAVGGTLAVFFGTVMLFKESGWAMISPAVLVAAMGGVSALLGALLYAAKKILGRQARLGAETAMGQKALTVTALEPEGQVFWRGELWRAESREGPIPANADVFIHAIDGLTLRVGTRQPAGKI